MDNLMERFDRLLTPIVPFLYLFGMIAGTAYYFTTGAYAGVFGMTTVGLILAGASELHSFLEQRRTRIAFKKYQSEGDPDKRERLQKEFQVHLGILIGLVVFQCFTATSYVFETWHPSASFIPAVAQQVIRGCVIPVLFLLTGFLANIAVDYAEMLEQGTLEMMNSTIRAVVRQWKKRQRRIERSGKNLAPLAVGMLEFHGNSQLADFVRTVDRDLLMIEQPGSDMFRIDPAEVQASVSRHLAPQPASSRSNAGSVVIPIRPPRSNAVQTAQERQDVAFEHLDGNPELTARELAKLLGVATATAHSDTQAWRASRSVLASFEQPLEV